jgi:hypothetical protein
MASGRNLCIATMTAWSMKQFILKIFTWWNSQTFGTQLWTWAFTNDARPSKL